MKLTRAQSAAHQRACQILEYDHLTDDDREFVLEHWQESSTSRNVLDGAFFTPIDLARTMRLHVYGDRVLDLCAGIGHLAIGCQEAVIRSWTRQPARELVCVERNPAYVEVGRKLLPEATWICADVFDVPGLGLGQFDTVIANPPFGRVRRDGTGPRYRDPLMEYHVIDVAADIGVHGAFIIPQTSAPFAWSGHPQYREVHGREYDRFEAETGITLEPSVGIDTSYYADQWRGVTPTVEIVRCDFSERAPVPGASQTIRARRILAGPQARADQARPRSVHRSSTAAAEPQTLW
ncbi:N-6 DNA methylase [Spirillospora sp. CA-128828]|uniref:N-6 DNA methylase n=1 Tax=Spirillospora sp. CA-128828 TaxID=3240033 RepID=UPI003D90EF6E